MYDLVVIGAGPAGLAAATTAVEYGLRVALVDAGTAPGGQYWRHPTPDAGAPLVEYQRSAHLHHDLATFRRLMSRLEAGQRLGCIDHLPQHHAWTLERTPTGFVAHLVDRSQRPACAALVRAPRIIVATGAYDRQVPFPGWDIPGVLTAGGAQALLKGHGVRAGSRVLVAGTGPFLLPVAAGLARAGTQVVGVHEANSPRRWLRHAPAVVRNVTKLGEAAAYAATLARHRVPVRTRSMVVAAEGDGVLESVTVARLGRDGRELVGSRRRTQVDTLAVGWGFTPQLDLLLGLGCATTVGDDGSAITVVDNGQETSVPGIFTAGETCGVGGAALAVVEGLVAGAAAAGRPPAAGLRRRRASLRAFASAMHRAHPVPERWPGLVEDDTVVCRCEEVTAGAMRWAVQHLGAMDGRDVKLLTRTGMGWCQGRVCGFAAAGLTAAWAGRPNNPTAAIARPVASPVPLGSLLIEAEEPKA